MSHSIQNESLVPSKSGDAIPLIPQQESNGRYESQIDSSGEHPEIRFGPVINRQAKRKEPVSREPTEFIRTDVLAFDKAFCFRHKTNMIAERNANESFRIFRPIHRPPMAIVSVLDDNGQTAEVIRVRANRFAIGRAVGDLVVSHDVGISGRHCELVRMQENDCHTWCMRDLNSRNGTFVGISEHRLRHGQELLIGTSRYRFEQNQSLDADEADKLIDRGAGTTASWDRFLSKHVNPGEAWLVQLGRDRVNHSFSLGTGESLVGSNAANCSVVINDDPFIEPHHCRIYRAQDEWLIEDISTQNGTWLRSECVTIQRFGAFQIGEQRLMVSVP